MRKIAFATLCLLYLIPSGWAKVEVLKFDSAEQEQRYQSLIKELRCLVCQNQNLADSNADLAKDLREKTYQMILAGSSDGEIVAYMVDRYGDFVLYRPPVKTSTIMLWLGPFIILTIGLLVVIIVIRGRRNQIHVAVGPQQHDKAQRLLHGDTPE